MSRVLFAAPLAVTILEAAASASPAALHATPPTTVDATLSLSADASVLTLRLAELSERLLLLSFQLDAAGYTALREEQAFRVGFEEFGGVLAGLLAKVGQDGFVAVLAGTDGMTFKIVEINMVRVLVHVQVAVVRASDREMMVALVARAREMEVRVRTTEEKTERVAAALREKETALARVQGQLEGGKEEAIALKEGLEAAERTEAARLVQVKELESIAARVAELEVSVDVLRKERDAARGEARSVPELRKELDTAKGAVGGESAARAKLQEELESVRVKLDAALAKYNVAVAEIRKGNGIIDRLENELRTARAKAQVKSAIIAKQEEAVVSNESIISTLERDLRRARDRGAMLEVEKEGLSGRLSSALSKLEENAALLASDQQVIAYLNRELNDRAIGESGASPGHHSSRRRRGSDGEGNRSSSSSSTPSLPTASLPPTMPAGAAIAPAVS